MDKKIDKYIEIVLKKGLNLQKNQPLFITSPVEIYDFTRNVCEMAYKLGASEVFVSWIDEIIEKNTFEFGSEEIFDKFSDWKKQCRMEYLDKGACFLSIHASNPDILKNVDKSRLARANKAKGMAMKDFQKRLMGNESQWCVISVPTKDWAKKVFPHLDEIEATQKLWDLILNVTRADRENPIVEWEKHLTKLKNIINFLNEKNFDKLIYKNSKGTNLEIGLPQGHIWVSGEDKNMKGVDFVANMPTEEVFTLPHKNRVNGTVVSSKPLIYGGNMIDEFKLTFENGKVVEYSAKVGEEILGKLLEMDNNACYLGEVALVEYDSPISNTNTIFYNTLYDENASCHLAFGSAYSSCLKDSSNLSEEELLAKGCNSSLVHEDFMIGTEDLEIIGVDKDGNETIIMKNGNYSI